MSTKFYIGHNKSFLHKISILIDTQILFHEFSHYFVAKLFGMNVYEVNINLMDGYVKFNIDSEFINYNYIAIIHASGYVGQTILSYLFLSIIKKSFSNRFALAMRSMLISSVLTFYVPLIVLLFKNKGCDG